MPGKLQQLPLGGWLAVPPGHGFQGGSCPEAVMGQRCRVKWGLLELLSAPPVTAGTETGDPGGAGAALPRGYELPRDIYGVRGLCWVLGVWLPLGAPSAPLRLGLAVARGGRAWVPAVAAFTRQVLAWWANVLGVEGEVSRCI